VQDASHSLVHFIPCRDHTFFRRHHTIGAKKYCVFSGSVINVSKDKSEITLLDTAGRVVVQVNKATTFTFVSSSNWKELKPPSFKDVNTGNYLTCLGPCDGPNQTWEGLKLAATSCTIMLDETWI
jgi:hypothetical protein